jgi:hypothetical protein
MNRRCFSLGKQQGVKNTIAPNAAQARLLENIGE